MTGPPAREPAVIPGACPVQWAGQHAVVTMPEHLDVSSAAQASGTLLAVINRGATTLTADMTTTLSCDYAGADALARAYKRAVASGAQLRLVVTDPAVRRVLSLSGIDRLVPAYPSLAAATLGRAPAPVPGAERTRMLLMRTNGRAPPGRAGQPPEWLLAAPPPSGKGTANGTGHHALVLAATAAAREHRARDLLDTIITSLVAARLSLQATLDLPAGAARAGITAVLGDLDDTIRMIRHTAFAAAPACPPEPHYAAAPGGTHA
jgi:anti-sigma B factor antagonist